jgi:hypothetical protein
MLPKNQSNKDKEDNNAIQLRENQKQTLQTEAVTIVLSKTSESK